MSTGKNCHNCRIEWIQANVYNNILTNEANQLQQQKQHNSTTRQWEMRVYVHMCDSCVIVSTVRERVRVYNVHLQLNSKEVWKNLHCTKWHMNPDPHRPASNTKINPEKWCHMNRSGNWKKRIKLLCTLYSVVLILFRRKIEGKKLEQTLNTI